MNFMESLTKLRRALLALKPFTDLMEFCEAGALLEKRLEELRAQSVALEATILEQQERRAEIMASGQTELEAVQASTRQLLEEQETARRGMASEKTRHQNHLASMALKIGEQEGVVAELAAAKKELQEIKDQIQGETDRLARLKGQIDAALRM